MSVEASPFSVTERRILLPFSLGWAGLLLLLLIPASVLLGMEKHLVGGAALAGLIALYLITQPRLAFWLFLGSLAFHIPYYGLPIGIYPYDIAAILFFGACVVDLWLNGGKILPTRLDIPFLMFIGAAWLSCLFAYEPARGIVSAGRLLFVYLMFRALVHYVPRIGLRKVVMAYFWFVVILSVGNMILFVLSGGTGRSFGTASVSYETFAMTGFAMAVWFTLRAVHPSERLTYALATLAIIGGTIASQSRGPLISFALTLPFVLIVASGRGKQEGRRSLLGGVILTGAIVGLIVAVIALFQGELFTTYLGRLQQIPNSLANPEGTILLRLVLWKAAFIAFLEHPLTGIGLGNFGIIEQIVLASKAHPLWYYVHDATAHNVVFHYMAETGLFGILSLLFLAWRGLVTARRSFRSARDARTATLHGALYSAMYVFLITLFFMRAWTWEQGAHVLSFLFATTALAYHNVSDQKTNSATS